MSTLARRLFVTLTRSSVRGSAATTRRLIVLSTESKIKAARILYRLLKLAGFKDEQRVVRSGIRFRLDLREGIDLAIFLFGGFQNHVAGVAPGVDDAVIFDVGANSGNITLAFARQHPRARIHSFEPTHFALDKLHDNLRLNPELAARVTVNHTFVGRSSGTMSPAEAYSSWRVDGITEGAAQEPHLGSMMSATNALTSLDDYASAHGIAAVHLIKIDTDGHEMEVLAGAQKLITACRPRIVLEMCPYLLAGQKLTFQDYADVLGPAYRMTDLRSGRPLDAALFAKVPRLGGIDVLASAS